MSQPAPPGRAEPPAPSGLRVVVANWRDAGHPEAGGAEVYAEQMAQELSDRGHKVTFLSAAYVGADAGLPARGRVEHLRSGGRWTVYPAVAWWLLRHRHDVDAVVDCQNGIPFFAPLWVRRRTAVVCVVHHIHTEQFGLHFPAPVAAVGRLLEGPFSRRVYGRRPAVAVSPSTAQALRSRLRWRGPIHIVPNGAPASTDPRTRDRRALLPTVVSVGRLVVHKRVQLLVEAAAKLAAHRPGLTVEIIGSGPELSDLRVLVETLGVGGVVSLPGRLDDEQVAAALDRAWLSVATTRGEGWGLSVLEAAARGLPTLAFEVEGVRDAVRPGRTGWLVDDGADLAAAMDVALDEVAEPSAAAELATACRDWAGEFTWANSGDRLEAVLMAEVRRCSSGRVDRREIVDEATLVELPADHGHALATVTAGLRGTDRAGVWRSRIWFLLTGCPSSSVPGVLARLGVRPESAVATRSASAEDLLRAEPLRGWTVPS